MRKLLLATSAAALALTFAGQAGAEPNKIIPAATTVAPPETTTTDGLVFSKDADQAKPIDKPGSQWPLRSRRSNRPNRLKQPNPPSRLPPSSPPLPSPPKTPRSPRQLKELVETKLSQYVPREQDRAGVLAFYQARNFAPIWIADGKPAPRAEQAKSFLKGVAADGLDPADYPTPGFTDPAKLAADELTLTNSVVTFARHASIGRVAFTRVSGAVYYDQKAPNPADVLGKLADSTDVRATLDAFNPQAPPTRRSRPSSPTSAAARPEPRPRQLRAGEGPEPKGSKSKEGAARTPRRPTPSRRPRAPTPSSPTWSAGAGCRTISARPT